MDTPQRRRRIARAVEPGSRRAWGYAGSASSRGRRPAHQVASRIESDGQNPDPPRSPIGSKCALSGPNRIRPLCKNPAKPREFLGPSPDSVGIPRRHTIVWRWGQPCANGALRPKAWVARKIQGIRRNLGLRPQPGPGIRFDFGEFEGVSLGVGTGNPIATSEDCVSLDLASSNGSRPHVWISTGSSDSSRAARPC